LRGDDPDALKRGLTQAGKEADPAVTASLKRTRQACSYYEKRCP